MVEDVVGHLIGTEGIDLVLIGTPASLSEASTDRLTLESLSGDVAVLDWKSPQEIAIDLDAIRFHCVRARHHHDPDAPDQAHAGAPRLYAFDMNRFGKSGDLISALRELNARRQVRTFAIGLSGVATTGSIPAESSLLALGSQRPTDSDATAPKSASVPSAAQPKRDSTGTTTSSLDLDDLIDQLDQADP